MDGKICCRWALCLAAVGAAGCGGSRPRTLSSDLFMPAGASAGGSVEQSKLEPATAPVAVAEKTETAEHPATAPAEVAAVPVIDSAAATSAPASQPSESGMYMTLGGVVAEVNGTPIYANTILALLDKEFAAKAKEMDSEQFRRFARYELNKARDGSIRDEVEFAAAQRGLSADDKKIIDLVMAQFLQQKITEAGGSIELARRRALADGITFEQMLHQRHRVLMWELYQQHRILPRVQVSANDMREFYNANVNRLYSQRNQAKFRVIKIDPARLGGDNPKAAAIARIHLIRDKAVRGDDFAALASSENHDDYLKNRGGDPGGWIERDAYRIDAIDKAIWKIEPGQVTEPIEDDGAFYIAKLEDRKIGKTQPFDDPAVQTDIMNRLRTQQLAELYDQLYKRLSSEAVVRGEHDEALLDAAVDIAMQKYPQWAAAR